jgi:hypothetical protein
MSGAGGKGGKGGNIPPPPPSMRFDQDATFFEIIEAIWPGLVDGATAAFPVVDQPGYVLLISLVKMDNLPSTPVAPSTPPANNPFYN